MIEEYLQHAITLTSIDLKIISTFLSTDQICQLPVQADVSSDFLLNHQMLIFYIERCKAWTSY